LFTAADAKIPLSVVQVKQEPQYVVFCCSCAAPSSATAHFSGAKQKNRLWMMKFALQNAEILPQTPALRER
jgi:hypothetical protein